MLDTDNACVVFTAHDRCDGCGAQAYTLAQRDDMPSELLFCLHHCRAVEETLLLSGWTIIYDYEAISQLADNEEINV